LKETPIKIKAKFNLKICVKLEEVGVNSGKAALMLPLTHLLLITQKLRLAGF
jgi:hypothetical protein